MATSKLDHIAKIHRIQNLGKGLGFISVILFFLLYSRIHYTLREVLVLFAFVGFLLSYRNCAEWLSTVRFSKYAGLFIFATAMALPQQWEINRSVFPFIPWHMYSRSTMDTEVVSYQLIGINKDGTELIINHEKLLWGVGGGTRKLSDELRERINQAINDPTDVRINESILSFLKAVGNKYNRKFAPVSAIRINRVSQSVEYKSTPSTMPTKWEIDLK